MEDITLTAEELQARIDDAVKKAVDDNTDTLNKKHSEEMANQRVKSKKEKEDAVAKAIADANLSAEERAAKKIEEERKAEQEELAQLRIEKKISERAKKLADAGLPDFMKHDNRLLSATDEEVDNVIKTMKEEYTKVLPKGATVSTNVTGGASTPGDDPFKDFRNEGVRK